MKKLLIALMIILVLVVSGQAFAADSGPAPSDDLAFPGINLQGDTAYLFRAKTLAVGVGSDIATLYNGVVTLRLEAITAPASADLGGSTLIGTGAMVNLPKLITRLGGQWQAKVINPSVGVMPLYDFRNSKYDVGLVVSVIRIDF